MVQGAVSSLFIIQGILKTLTVLEIDGACGLCSSSGGMLLEVISDRGLARAEYY
jgi:hypothetical protein